MSSLNTYFDAIKPLKKSLQEQATKFSTAFDETLKKTEVNLEKKRIKVVKASDAGALPHVMRLSKDKTLGEMVVVPPPSPVAPSTPSPPPARKTSDDSKSQTVERKRSRRHRRLDELENANERKHQIHQCLHDMITEIIEKEEIENCLNHLVEMIVATEEFAEKTSIHTVSSEENSMESINTNEEQSDLSETQSNILETELTESISPLDSCPEKTEFLENNISVETPEEPINSAPTDPKEELFLNSLPPTSKIIDTSIIKHPPVSIPKEKRFSLVYPYSLPTDAIISHMSCSSTYIYICTPQHAIHYTRVPEIDVYHSLNWYRYALPAERVIVSRSNQTIWRVFEKCIYSSTDTIKISPLGINWEKLSFLEGENLLSISINDQCGWFIKEDETLWLVKITDENPQPLNVSCPFNLNHVVCSDDKIGVTTNDGQILIRIGCTDDCPEGGGWIFIEHDFGPFEDFTMVTYSTMIAIIDKKHRIWIHDWSLSSKFYEVLRNDEYTLKPTNLRYSIDMNEKFLCFTDCQKQLFLFSNCLTGVHWSLVEKETRLQRLIGALPNENHVWALTTDGMIRSSNGRVLDKPRQAQSFTHASFVPRTDSENIIWALDESCNIYTRANLDEDTQWEQLDQSQFDWSQRLVDIVCNSVGVWAVDDRGCIHFRHGHSSNSSEYSLLNPAWIQIPGEPINHRSFAQIFCGPKNWMVYATDIKQTVYARDGIDETNHIGTSWKVIEDCSALGLAISEHTLWLLTSHGRIQCRENISLKNPIGKRTTTLPGRFNSIIVSTDDEQMWALYPPHHLFKLDRLTILFEK